MNAVITTCDRQPEYVHQTIATLLLSEEKLEKIFLIIDGDEGDYLKYYKNPLIVKYFHNDNDKRYFEQFVNHPEINRIRGSYNYCRCLYLIDKLKKDCILIEDDVVVNSGWINQLNLCLSEINDLNPFLLSLRAKREYEHKTFKKIGKNTLEYVPYEVKPNVACYFAGTQSVFYSKNFKFNDMIGFILKKPEEPYDIRMAKFLLTYNVKAYHSIVGLFCHVGKVTSIGTEEKQLEIF